MTPPDRHPASFRDPSGFLFRRHGVLFRQVNRSFADHYRAFVESGLYDELVEAGLLVAHEEVDEPPATPDAAVILRPELVPFVSHPYEWCFSQLKDAALLTLDLQRRALRRGLWLRDASAYNVQFRGSRPIFIDTLSFEPYPEGSPWVAYRQFCQHFLAPLALTAYRDVRLAGLVRKNIDGVPLDLATELLPGRAKLRFGLLTHLFWHARSQKSLAESRKGRGHFTVSRRALEGLIESLAGAVGKLDWDLPATQWGDYYGATNYSAESAAAKAALVSGYLDRVAPATVWDLGANTGRFSRLATDRGAFTVAFDIDPVAVERAYLEAKGRRDEALLPLLLDLTNPSPALGWAHAERQSLEERGPAELVMALALIHHLAIGNNVPLPMVAGFLARLGAWAVVELVPKSDSQVERLLASREDIFPDYDEGGFVRAFSEHFEIVARDPVSGTERTLFLMRSLRSPADR